MLEPTKQQESGTAQSAGKGRWERPELKEHGELREITKGPPFGGPGDLLGDNGIPTSQG